MNHSVGISGYNSNKDVQMCSQFRGDRIQNDIKEHFLNTSRMHGPDSVIHPCVLKHHASEPVPRLACMFSLYLKNNIFPTYKPAWVQPNPMKDNFQSFQMSSYWCNLFFSKVSITPQLPIPLNTMNLHLYHKESITCLTNDSSSSVRW